MLVEKIDEDQAPFKRVFEPSHPDADKEGYVNMPNVEVVTEMVDLINASRSYEANMQAAAVPAKGGKSFMYTMKEPLPRWRTYSRTPTCPSACS